MRCLDVLDFGDLSAGDLSPSMIAVGKSSIELAEFNWRVAFVKLAFGLGFVKDGK
jgi:hypothetical protein